MSWRTREARVRLPPWEDTAQAELFIKRGGEMFKHVLRFLRASPEGKIQLVQ